MSSAPVRFISTKFKTYTLIMREETPILFDPTGTRVIRERMPAKHIVFKNNVFETSDPEEIEFIRNHPNFVGYDKNAGVDAFKCISEAAPPNKVQQQLLKAVGELGEEAVLAALGSLTEADEEPVEEVEAPKRRGRKKQSDDFLVDEE